MPPWRQYSEHGDGVVVNVDVVAVCVEVVCVVVVGVVVVCVVVDDVVDDNVVVLVVVVVVVRVVVEVMSHNALWRMQWRHATEHPTLVSASAILQGSISGELFRITSLQPTSAPSMHAHKNANKGAMVVVVDTALMVLVDVTVS